jgi:hypothetical protein
MKKSYYLKFTIIIFLFASFFFFGLATKVEGTCYGTSQCAVDCAWYSCSGPNPDGSYLECYCDGGKYCCERVSSCGGCGGGGCFTGETEIGIGQEGERAGEQEGETKQIKDLKPGDVVESFNPETGEIKEGTVSDVTKTTREGYYILETEGGYKVKVTAEHPFLAIKSEKEQESINQVSNFKNQLKEIFSNTLTYRFLANLQAKFTEAF